MRYRASIYIDIEAAGEASAKGKAEEIAEFLSTQEGELPEDYYNAYVGGVGEITKDPIETANNLEKI